MVDDCLMCAKHRGQGPLVGPVIASSALLVVSHLPARDGAGFPGYVFIETRRHVAYLDELTTDEARAVGEWTSCAARALRAELDPEHVLSLVSGVSVAHFHQHVFARHRGVPDDVPILRGHLGPDAAIAPASAIDELCERLARHFA